MNIINKQIFVKESYFEGRGFDKEIVREFRLKEESKHIEIPYYDINGNFHFNKCRSKFSKNFWYYPKNKKLILYNICNLDKYSDYIVICESEIDCLTLLQWGINAVACPGSNLFRKEWVRLFDNIDKIYICFDNDLAGIEGAMKLSEDFFSHRDTYNILIPREKEIKDINDLLIKADYKKESFLILMKEAIKHDTKLKKSKKKSEEKKEITVSKIISNNKIVEIVYSKTKREGGFLIYDVPTGKIQKEDYFKDGDITYLPDINDDLIINNVIRIPSDAKDYGDTLELLSDIHRFIMKYVDIEDDLERDIIATYTLLTWVYDRFNAIPYLRVMGQYGTGKTRLLEVLNICYKSIDTSGNASSAPIFRLIDRYGGTLLIDEIELGRNTDKNEEIKEILRFGKDRNGVILKCDGPNFAVRAYKAFGPKVFGSRKSYNDDALESRIINIKMKETKRNDIPLILEIEEFEKDSEEIRCKLLKWRFENYFKIDILAYKKYIDVDVSKRINEMNAPLICIRNGDEQFINNLINRSEKRYKQLMEDKSMSLNAEIIKEIIKINSNNQEDPLLKEIAERISENTGKRHTARLIGTIVRDNLSLETDHKREGNIVIYDAKKINKLIKEYNLEN